LANLLVAVGSAATDAKTRDAFRSALELTNLVKSQTPIGVIETPFACVASFARRNGSGTPVIVDPATGNWIVAVGTWFHTSGFQPGDEIRLLQRLNDVGPERLANELEGFFVIATGNAAARTVTVITDTLGLLHCYSRHIDGVVLISTSSLALASVADVTIDAIAVQEFLQTAAMYEDRTFFREVRKLESARCYCYANGALRSDQRYWQVSDLSPDSRSGVESVAAFRQASLDMAGRLANAYPRLAVDLTGGYDSRVTVAAFLGAGATITTTVAGPPASQDVTIANKLAGELGLEHRFITTEPITTLNQLEAALQLTDGECDLVDYARVEQVQRTLAGAFDVSVNGYSGEIGRGYGWELLVPVTGRRLPLDVDKIARRRFVNPNFDASIIPTTIRIDAATHFRAAMARTISGLEQLPNTLQYDYCMTMLRCQRWYGRIASSTDQIYPCLSFFLQRSVFTPMLETDTRSRRNSILFRRFLAQTNSTLAHYPLAAGYPPVPVSWTTFYRFWPLLPYYGGKAVGRLRRRLLPNGAAAAASSENPRLRLWRDSAVEELLQPSRMHSARFLDEDGLNGFLAASRAPQFRYADQWSLLLTLECALTQLASIRARHRAQQRHRD
jgi:hypothetical protein